MPSPWAEWLIGLCLFAATVSTFVYWMFLRALRRITWRDRPLDPPAERELISVIVPARNEEVDVGAGLRSILRQIGVQLEVIAVNDHSSDATGRIMDDIAATDARLTVIHNPELRPGWFGKVNAMHQAAERASGQYLLFTDADIEHEPDCFRMAVAELQRQGVGLFSLFPKLHCVTLWENAVLPMYMAGMAQFAGRSIEDERSQHALAAGALILVRAEDFHAVGGWEPVRREMLDDVGIARLFKQHGHRVGFRVAPDLMSVRLFKSNHDAFWGSTKNILAGLHGHYWLAPVAMLLPFLVFWSPLVALVLGIIWGSPLVVGIGSAVYVLEYAGLYLGRGQFVFHPMRALCFPLIAISVFCSFARALYFYFVRGSILWRNRAIRLDGAAAD
ncbi:MAG TPA: glycosyltransferase family 2 protein [Planctomycetaceae bacterium]|nr:glycosyltransferase family 2 protein [Planctomycetaceae bacterium]